MRIPFHRDARYSSPFVGPPSGEVSQLLFLPCRNDNKRPTQGGSDEHAKKITHSGNWPKHRAIYSFFTLPSTNSLHNKFARLDVNPMIMQPDVNLSSRFTAVGSRIALTMDNFDALYSLYTFGKPKSLTRISMRLFL
jgi:hypothetical protein